MSQHRVLIADDVLFAQKLYTAALRDLPVVCYYASDGEEAVRIAGVVKPHLVLMDYRMPRMNGDEAAQIIRALPSGQHAKILALSSESAEKMRTLKGFDGFLIKPVRLEQLSCLVREYLGLHEGAPCAWNRCSHGPKVPVAA
ncbi:MAG: response regulator [Bdellovibrionota bacterium]